jgi:phosphate:Na+ symporter
MDKAADYLHRSILGYLGKISIGSLSHDQAHNLMQLVAVANDLEHIGDRVATDIVTSAQKRLDERTAVSEHAITAITALHGEVTKALRDALIAVRTEDETLAATVRRMKREVSAIVHTIERDEVSQLAADPSHRVMSYVREVEFLEILDGVFRIARRIARSQLKAPVLDEAAD